MKKIMKFTISSILLLTAFLWLGFENVYADDDPINLMKDVNTEELTIKTISQEDKNDKSKKKSRKKRIERISV